MVDCGFQVVGIEESFIVVDIVLEETGLRDVRAELEYGKLGLRARI